MATSVGTAVTNFISIATAAIPATVSGGDTNVVFGDLAQYVAPVTLQIIEVTGDAQVAELGQNFRREETFSIVCELVTWAGDQDYKQRFDDAVTVYDLVTIAVATNPWLSSTGSHDNTSAVRFAEIGDFSIIPKAGPEGESTCSFQFHVRCSARVDSLD